MIIMGAGICQWFHGDATYRAILALLIFNHRIHWDATAAAGRTMSARSAGLSRAGSPWPTPRLGRPNCTMIATMYWYMHRDQWRSGGYAADAHRTPLTGLASPWHGTRRFSPRVGGAARLDAVLPVVRPQPTRPRGRARPGKADRGPSVGLRANPMWSAVGSRRDLDVDAPGTCIRLLTLWRLKPDGLEREGKRVLPQAPAGNPQQPHGERRGRGAAHRGRLARRHPRGKLDLLVSADFRMTSTSVRRRVPSATGTRSTTCPRPTCIRSCSVQPGHRPAVGGEERLRPLPRVAEEFSRWPARISELRRTSCRCPFARPGIPGGRRVGRTTARRSPCRSRAGRCRSSPSSSATTRLSLTSYICRTARRHARVHDQERHL